MIIKVYSENNNLIKYESFQNLLHFPAINEWEMYLKCDHVFMGGIEIYMYIYLYMYFQCMWYSKAFSPAFVWIKKLINRRVYCPTDDNAR